jgi:bacteriocin biosynthesis cyclodehydratase domain-containing protein
MLVPGLRLIERPGALHLFDGRRVVSLTGDEPACTALRAAMTPSGGIDVDPRPPADAAAVADARQVLAELRLFVSDTDDTFDTDAGALATSHLHRPDVLSAESDRAAPTAVAADYVSAATAGWVTAGRARQRLRNVTVHVLALGEPGAPRPDQRASPLEAALLACGLRVHRLREVDGISRLDPERDIVAAVAPDGDPVHPVVAANDACVAARIPLFPVGAYDGARLHVGPLVVPGQSACLDCMRRRAAANVTFTDVFDAVTAAPSAPTPSALRQWSSSVAALALLRWIGDRDVRIPGRVFTLVPDELQIRQAVAYRVPRCRVCAAPDYVVRAAPWETARDH